MTIKEIEERSGIPRANIRYYETEGCLTPARGSNGYRDYSESDLKTLLKIKLLRSIHISLEDIKILQQGNHELTDILKQHLQILEEEQQGLEYSKAVCMAICNEGASYNTLNAQRYLDYMQRSFKEDSGLFEASLLKNDVAHKENILWTRFFARILDTVSYGVLWNVFLMCICNVNVMLQTAKPLFFVTEVIIVIIMVLVLEPVLLSVFGTTFGKCLLGLYVVNLEGEKLTYQESLLRTLQVIGYGPTYLVRTYHCLGLHQSYTNCLKDEDMEWEYGSNVLRKQSDTNYVIPYMLGCMCVFAILYVGNICAKLPPHRGDITVSEFCNNFNQLSEYYQYFENRKLSESGEWIEEEVSAAVVEYTTENVDGPQFHFTEENGVLTEVKFVESFILPPEKASQHSPFGMVFFYQREMAMAVLAFLPASEVYPVFSDRAYEIAEYILKNSYEDFEIEAYGVSISYDLEYTNFENMKQKGFLIKLDDSVEARCSITFSMELQ